MEKISFKLLPFLFSFFIFTNCGDRSTKEYEDAINEADNSEYEEVDNQEIAKEEITTLLQNLYEWKENKDSESIDFDVLAGDRVYTKINPSALKKRISTLKETDFFSKKFLDNYSKIAKGIDNYLQSGEEEVLVGDMMPFGNGANPWCNCQDSPEKYWQNLKIDFYKIDDKRARGSWTFGDSNFGKDFNYYFEVLVENGIWKIDYLQGFDHAEYFHISVQNNN